tara:strand:+ start:9393 stop:10457 length:1065 start_codon:yes stop_codon:yes gene_type:complete
VDRRDFLKSAPLALFGGLIPKVISGHNDYPTEVVDIHMHLVGESESNGCFISSRSRRSVPFKFLRQFLEIDNKSSPDEQDRQYVQMLRKQVESMPFHYYGILLAMDGIYNEKGELDYDRTPFYISNEYLFKVCRESDHFYPGASVNPNRKDALEELEKVLGNGAVLIKWLPNSQNIDPSDTGHIPFYRMLTEHNIPLLVHGGKEHTVPVEDQTLGNPDLLTIPLEEGVQVIAAHCADSGGDRQGSYFERFLKLLDKYPNLYGDISSLTFLHKTFKLRYFLNHPNLFDRLFYGSDFPLVSTPMISSLYFLGKLSIKEMINIEGIDNDLEKNLQIVRTLGIPEDCFRRGKKLLKMV